MTGNETFDRLTTADLQALTLQIDALLTGIVRRADVLLHTDVQADAVSHGVNDIRNAAGVALGLVDQLLVVTRSHPVANDLGQPETHVHDAIASVAASLGELIHGQARLAYRMDARRPWAAIDRDEFQQLLLNVVANAAEATPSGGLITVATRDADGVVDGASQLILEVSDTGHGMTEEVCRRAFEPYFTTKAVGRGQGLGLTAVQTIIARARGRVTVESAVGRGTTVRVHLRRPRPEPEEPA